MAKRVCYCLIPRSPFHFGERGVGMEEASVLLHADTLFSALCLTLVELGENIDDLLARFPRIRFKDGSPAEVLRGSTPFLLSSAFPFCSRREAGQLVEPIFFFPKPFLRLQNQDNLGDIRLLKDLKRIQFVSKPIFEAILNDSPPDFALDDLIQGKKIWLTPDEKQRISTGWVWTEETQPHVTVDRASNSSQVYAVGQIRFDIDAGLFFLIDYNEEEFQPIVEKAIRALGDSGIGGERSSGRGQFDLIIREDFSLTESDNPNAFITLSLYWPNQPEVQTRILNGASYGLIQRRGWVASIGNSNLRRRGVRMLTEGSVFLQKPSGALADVKPLDPETVPNAPHDIWRYGMAFPLGCRITKDGSDG